MKELLRSDTAGEPVHSRRWYLDAAQNHQPLPRTRLAGSPDCRLSVARLLRRMGIFLRIRRTVIAPKTYARCDEQLRHIAAVRSELAPAPRPSVWVPSKES